MSCSYRTWLHKSNSGGGGSGGGGGGAGSGLVVHSDSGLMCQWGSRPLFPSGGPGKKGSMGKRRRREG